MKPKAVRVHWVDSATFGGWQHVKEVPSLEPEPCVTVGLLIDDDGTWLRVAGSVSLDAKGRVSSACDVIAIPWCAVITLAKV